MKRGDDKHQQCEQDREDGQKRIAPPLPRATEAFFRVLPDRRPENGPLSTITQGPLTFRPGTGPNPAVDFVRTLNDMAIVVEVPTAWLTNPATNGRFGVWGTTSKRRS